VAGDKRAAPAAVDAAFDVVRVAATADAVHNMGRVAADAEAALDMAVVPCGSRQPPTRQSTTSGSRRPPTRRPVSWQRGGQRRRRTLQHTVKEDDCGGTVAENPPQHPRRHTDPPHGAAAAPRAGGSSSRRRAQRPPKTTAPWRVCSGRRRGRGRRGREALNAVWRGLFASVADNDQTVHSGSFPYRPPPAPAIADGVLESLGRPTISPSAPQKASPVTPSGPAISAAPPPTTRDSSEGPRTHQ